MTRLRGSATHASSSSRDTPTEAEGEEATTAAGRRVAAQVASTSAPEASTRTYLKWNGPLRSSVKPRVSLSAMNSSMVRARSAAARAAGCTK